MQRPMSTDTPPPWLTTRAGGPHEHYDSIAYANRQRIEGLLPADWSFEGKRILDFGCGAGRSLAVFADHAEDAEFVGCDLHEPSIEWATRHLSPRFEFFLNGPEPPLDRPAESFDLIYGVSVFTHVTANWAPWLLEIHRVLRPGGLAMFSFLGEKMWRNVLARDWDADRLGMIVSSPHRPWDHGGPDAFHSEWWLRAHWGRVFEIVHLDHGPADIPGHGWIVLRRDERTPPTVAELVAPEPGEPREVLSGQSNVELLSDQLRDVYAHAVAAEAAAAEARAERDRARLERDESWRRYESVVKSKSWTLTRPLRSAVKRARRR
jgi:SAM-dependent methyltransferase